MSDAITAAARQWRAAGFQSGPTHANSKNQFSTRSIRYHRHWTTDPAQVDSLWAGKFADSNIAIKCAPGRVIVDADKRNGGMKSAIALGLLDADGMPIGGAYAERTRDDGRRIVYTLSDGLGRGLKAGLLAPGLELTFEGSQSLVLVAPSVVDGRPYVALSDALNFTPAPACIVEFAQRLQAARTPRPATITPGAPGTTPQSIKSRYADATLLNICDELRNTLKGTRYDTLRRVSLVMGSVCAACDVGTAEAARQLETATGEWAEPNKVKATIKSGLAKGMNAPAVIDWKHSAPDTFRQAGEVVMQWLQDSTWAGVQVCRRGNVSTASVQTIATAMAEYSQTHRLYGAFAISVRSLRLLTGCGLQTIHNALSALCTDGILAIVGRDEYAFIQANGTDGTAGDKRLQARVYVFNLAEIGRRILDTARTVSVHRREGEQARSYDLPFSAPVTVLAVSKDVFTNFALGRSAAAVLSKLLSAPAGLDDDTLAEHTGLHVRTVGRAVARLALHGFVVTDDAGMTRAVDADAIQAAVAGVVNTFELEARREKRETTIRAERAAHSAYVLARRAGIGEADAQRLYRHVYNAIAHPLGQQDTIDADGVITPANAAPAPTPADYVNQWKQYAADAQAKRDAANVPTLTPEQIAQAKAKANVNRYGAKFETLQAGRERLAMADLVNEVN